MTTITSYTEAAAFMAKGRNKTSRKAANNTYIELRDAHSLAVRLHATDVVIYHDNGDITLDTGGWLTVTTKERLNSFTPRAIRVYSKRSKAGSRWVVGCFEPGEMGWEAATSFTYVDGMTLHFDGERWTTGKLVDEAKLAKEDEANAKINGQITRYAALYTKDKLIELVEYAREHGTQGDCWFCAMLTDEGIPLGDKAGDTSHLMEHMKDKYVMLSLAVNALVMAKHYDRSRAVNVIMYGMDHLVREAVREYLRARLYTAGVTIKNGRRPTDRPLSRSTGF